MAMLTAKRVEKLIRVGGVSKTSEDAPRGTGRLMLWVRGERAEWYFRYFIQGKDRNMKLGNASGDGSLSLAEARKKVDPFRNLLLEGKDPKVEIERQEQARQARARQDAERGSVEQLFQEYVDDLKRRGKGSWQAVERALLTGRYAVVDELGAERKAADVTGRDIKAILRKTYDRGAKAMAAHLRAYLHGAFKYGLTHELDYTRTGQDVAFSLEINPVSAIPVDREAKNVGQRVLSTEEIKEVWNTMGKHGATDPVWNAIKLIFATGGQRVGEVLGIRREELDFMNKVWNLPGERTKNGRDHPIPLTDLALEIIGEALDDSKSDLVFPNSRNPSQPMPVATMGRAVARYCEKAEQTYWTPRDIRRTVRTMLAENREPGWRLDVLLNHGTTVGVGEKHYEKAQRLKDKTITMTKWDKLLLKALGREQSKVIKIAQSR